MAAPLGLRAHSFQAKIIGKPGHKGGMRSYASTWPELVALLKQERHAVVTTFFDLYGLAADWPGWSEPGKQNAEQRAEAVERAVWDDLRAKVDQSENLKRFIPYLQVHELETLLYSNPKVLAESLGEPALAADFERIVADAGGCEQINDSPETAPSKRLEKLFPRYKKGKGQRAHAPLAVSKIGLNSIRAACPRFSRWLQQLENVDRLFL